MMPNSSTGMKNLVEVVKKIESDPIIRRKVEHRILEFKAVQNAGSDKWFEELVFCLLTANYSAKGALSCILALDKKDALQTGGVEEVKACLMHRHRFPKKRAEFIVKARLYRESLKKVIQSQISSQAARVWLVENILGLGMKEASHFLRNVGYLDLAIIDKHILTHMVEQRLITERPKSITKKKYLEYESLLSQVAKKLDMPLGKMDLYLWANKSGEVIK
ncbi:N-glycosylase/DNA lyase [Candidatus Bathyarchaeota archaeon]|nr:N-glycosylase/DNA lyase [Candidatus Bathyarchaeota archaeon]